jgi:hypothetical protein
MTDQNPSINSGIDADMAALLGEVNGGAQDVTDEKTKTELAKAHAESTADPLQVAPPAAGSATARFQAAATAKGPVRGYRVTVEGLYLSPSKDVPTKSTKKPYKLVVNLTSIEGALSTIKNKMLDKLLKMSYPDYKTYSTHVITNVERLSEDTPPVDNVAYMDLPKLLQFIEFKKVPVDVKTYGEDVVNLRNAVVDFLLNPKGFEEREEKRLADLMETRELEKLNPDMVTAGVDAVRGAPEA